MHKHENTIYSSLSLAVKSYPITELYITHMGMHLQSLLQLLCHNNTLTVLDIRGFYIYIGLEETLDVSNCKNVSLRDLRITGCNLSSVVDEIGKLLSHNKSIVFANFSCTEMGDSEVEKLVQNLKINNSLQHLDLSCNNITAVGIDHLGRLMTSDDPLTLTSIELSNNPLKDEGVCLLMQALTAPMEHIALNFVEMTSSSCQSVANALHKVKSISLTTPDEPEVIGVGIANTSLLESIELSNLNESTHYKIISGVKQNNSINSLTLCYDNCNADKCIEDLSQFIKCNKSITELIINCRTASPQILLSVADFMATNTFIKYFNFYLVYELRVYDPNEIKEIVLAFLSKIPPLSVLENLTLSVHGDYDYDLDFYSDEQYELKIKIDYDYHQKIEECVKEINNIRGEANLLEVIIDLS